MINGNIRGNWFMIPNIYAFVYSPWLMPNWCYLDYLLSVFTEGEGFHVPYLAPYWRTSNHESSATA